MIKKKRNKNTNFDPFAPFLNNKMDETNLFYVKNEHSVWSVSGVGASRMH